MSAGKLTTQAMAMLAPAPARDPTRGPGAAALLAQAEARVVALERQIAVLRSCLEDAMDDVAWAGYPSGRETLRSIRARLAMAGIEGLR